MKTILKSMTCIAIGAMMAEPAAAQQKDNYPELEGARSGNYYLEG